MVRGLARRNSLANVLAKENGGTSLIQSSAAEALPAGAKSSGVMPPGAASSGPAVALADVPIPFRMGGNVAFTAVEQASLSVADGEFVSIVGPTGCGKSTLLNVAAGLLQPSAGKAEIFGAPLTGLNRQS